MSVQLLIATANPGKTREIQAILAALELELITPHDITLELTVSETGADYVQNARLKAHAYAKASGRPSLADDSGLEVDILDGAPGMYSARYSPKPDATDADRRAYLLEQLKNYPRPWTAHFHCTAVFTIPGKGFLETTGRCNGVIIPEERGQGGFGYDPIFYLPEYDATLAELPTKVKNQISHRARALKAMIPKIKTALLDG